MKNKNRIYQGVIALTCFIITLFLTFPGELILKAPGFVPSYDWFEKQRAYPFKEIPEGERVKTLLQRKQMENRRDNYSPAFNQTWELLGPTNVEGRITTIATDPVDDDIVYVGTANGGLWKSTDFCLSWSSLFDDQNTQSIGDVAVDPENPLVIWCGTGESNSLRSVYPGTGIYKSTDGGESWELKGLENSYSIARIAVNPENSDIVYAAAMGALRKKNDERGIYKTTDGGESWERVLFHSDSVSAVDVILNPRQPEKVYAAMWERFRREDYIKYGGEGSALYRSTDSGETWEILDNGFPSGSTDLGRISMDLCLENPGVIYSLTSQTNGMAGPLYKTIDSGESWTRVLVQAAYSSSYAWFNRICRVNPRNSQDLFCGGLDIHRSTDGGYYFEYAFDTHVDQHAVAYSLINPQKIIIGNDGGIDYTSNGGTGWHYNNKIPVTQFYAGAVHPSNPDQFMGGTQDNGTNTNFDFASGGTGNWIMVAGGDGFYCEFDYENPQYAYSSSQYGYLSRSTDGGNSFNGSISGLDRTYTNWMTPYVIDKNNPEILYAGTYKVHKSTDRMRSWTPVSEDMANAHVENLGTITTIDVSASDPRVIYCGTDDANLWVTLDGGGYWELVNEGLPERWVTRVTIHPDSANVCYTTLSGYKIDEPGSHIYRTSDYGQTWISIGTGLPGAPVNDILVDPRDDMILYAATDAGVFYTVDRGENWAILGEGLVPASPCHDLTYYELSGQLYVWTHGRGAYRIQLPPIVGVTTEIEDIPEKFSLGQNYPNPFNPSTNIHFSLPEKSEVKIIIYNINGEMVTMLINGNYSKGKHIVSWNASGYSSGVYLCRLFAQPSQSPDNFISCRKLVLIK